MLTIILGGSFLVSYICSSSTSFVYTCSTWVSSFFVLRFLLKTTLVKTLKTIDTTTIMFDVCFKILSCCTILFYSLLLVSGFGYTLVHHLDTFFLLIIIAFTSWCKIVAPWSAILMVVVLFAIQYPSLLLLAANTAAGGMNSGSLNKYIAFIVEIAWLNYT